MERLSKGMSRNAGSSQQLVHSTVRALKKGTIDALSLLGPIFLKVVKPVNSTAAFGSGAIALSFPCIAQITAFPPALGLVP